ncbi:SWEET family sugar transporter [Caniella muris]|uniref:SWEET family sugar transporter n=1 Tax=Caniella muris TaxID=2941502 RepID=UPI0020423981|nr:SWEET family sugar transporter [Caniella muris]
MADTDTRTAAPVDDARRVRAVKALGRVASCLSVLMYVSYIPQIANNLAGNYGSPVQPFVAMVNCVFWTAYGLLERPRDMPIVVANIPGIVLGCVTFLTALH